MFGLFKKLKIRRRYKSRVRSEIMFKLYRLKSCHIKRFTCIKTENIKHTTIEKPIYEIVKHSSDLFVYREISSCGKSIGKTFNVYHWTYGKVKMDKKMLNEIVEYQLSRCYDDCKFPSYWLKGEKDEI